MPRPTPPTVEQLREKLAAAADSAAAHKRAIAEQDDARGELLAAVVAIAAAHVEALGGKVAISATKAFDADKVARESRQFYAAPLLHLAGDNTARQDAPSANMGRYRGKGLFLSTAGELLELAFDGTWSKGIEGTAWTATVRRVTPAEAAVAWKVDEILAHLVDVADRQDRSTAVEKIDRGTAKLRAILTLIKEER